MAGGITWRATNHSIIKLITHEKAAKYSQSMSKNNPQIGNNTTELIYH